MNKNPVDPIAMFCASKPFPYLIDTCNLRDLLEKNHEVINNMNSLNNHATVGIFDRVSREIENMPDYETIDIVIDEIRHTLEENHVHVNFVIIPGIMSEGSIQKTYGFFDSTVNHVTEVTRDKWALKNICKNYSVTVPPMRLLSFVDSALLMSAVVNPPLGIITSDKLIKDFMTDYGIGENVFDPRYLSNVRKKEYDDFAATYNAS